MLILFILARPFFHVNVRTIDIYYDSVFNIVGREFSKLDKYDDIIGKLGGTLSDDALHSKALAQSGLTQAVYDYVASLGVTSAAEMTFTQKLKMSAIALKEQAAAFWASPLGKAAVIGAAIFAIVKIINAVKQSIEEARQEAIASADAAAQLSDEISTLTLKYASLSEAVKTDESAKESLISTQSELIEKLGLEQYEIDQLIEKYGSLSEAILKASKDDLQMAEIDLRKGLDTRTTELLEAVGSAMKDAQTYSNNYISMPGIGAFTEGLGLFPTDEDYAELEKFKNDTQAAFEALKEAGMLGAEAMKNGKGDYLLDLNFDLNSVDGIIDAHARLGEMLRLVDDEAGQNNAIFTELNAQYERLDAAVNNYTDSVGELNKNLANQYILDGLINAGEVPDTQEEFDAYRQSVIDAAIASGEFVGSTEQISSAIDGVLRSDVSFAQFYDDVADGASNAATEAEDSAARIKSAMEKMAEASTGLSTRLSYAINDLASEDGKVYASTIKEIGEAIASYEEGHTGWTSEETAYNRLADAAKEYGLSVDELLTILIDLGLVQDDIAATSDKIATSFSSLKEELSTVNSAISEQATTGSITLETYNALIAASSDYASCIEYENGYMQLNAEKARELIDAKTQLQILELEQAKIDEAENYKRIAQALEDAADSDAVYRAALEAELEVSGQLIQKYRVMQSELAETLSAYTPYGAVAKTVHFILDGQELDPVVTTASGTLQSYSLPAQEHGAHLLECYITATVNSLPIETAHIFKDIVWFDEDSTTPVIGCIYRSDYYSEAREDNDKEPGKVYARQYDSTNLVYHVFDPATGSPTVTHTADGATSSNTLNGSTNTWTYKTDVVGDHTLVISCKDTSVTIVMAVQELGVEIAPVTANLAFDFNPISLSNNSSDRLWIDEKTGVALTVSDNFDWTNGGYQLDADGNKYFCVKAGTEAYIDYKLFAQDASVSGSEFKVIFNVTNVRDVDATFLSCVAGETPVGLRISTMSTVLLA